MRRTTRRCHVIWGRRTTITIWILSPMKQVCKPNDAQHHGPSFNQCSVSWVRWWWSCKSCWTDFQGLGCIVNSPQVFMKPWMIFLGSFSYVKLVLCCRPRKDPSFQISKPSLKKKLSQNFIETWTQVKSWRDFCGRFLHKILVVYYHWDMVVILELSFIKEATSKRFQRGFQTSNSLFLDSKYRSLYENILMIKMSCL